MQNTHNNTPKENGTKTWRHPDAALLLMNEPQMKWTDEEIKKLCSYLIDYCLHAEEGLYIEYFLLTNGIPPSTFYAWTARKPWVKKIKDNAMAILAVRRASLAEFRKMDKELFMRHQHKFDVSYHKDVNQYWKELQNKEEMDKALELIMYAAKNTDRVPPKTEKQKICEEKQMLKDLTE